jgi:hypothetical protein
MVSCGEFLAELGNYLEGGVPVALRRELELHLAECNTCQVIVDSTQKTLKLVTDCGELDLSEKLPESTVAAIMQKVRAKGSRQGEKS